MSFLKGHGNGKKEKPYTPGPGHSVIYSEIKGAVSTNTLRDIEVAKSQEALQSGSSAKQQPTGYVASDQMAGKQKLQPKPQQTVSPRSSNQSLKSQGSKSKLLS